MAENRRIIRDPFIERDYSAAVETDLVRWAQSGDREAFRRLVELHKQKAYALAFQML